MASRNEINRSTSKVNPDLPHENRDPITEAPGYHPVGTGVGAAGAGVAGALIGSAGGPIGTVVGAVVGAVAGGLAGKEVGEAINPTDEDAFWRENYRKRPYVHPGSEYETYRPAYKFGWESFGLYAGQPFEIIEPDLRRTWESRNPAVEWTRAKEAVKDSFDRVYTRKNDFNVNPVDDVEPSPTPTGRPVDRRDVAGRTAADLGRDEARKVETEVP